MSFGKPGPLAVALTAPRDQAPGRNGGATRSRSPLRRSPTFTDLACVAVLAATSLAVVGCGSSNQSHTSQVERELKPYLHNRTGEAIKSTDCPEHVENKLGSTFRCRAVTRTGVVLVVTMEQISEPKDNWINTRVTKVARSTKREREFNAKYARIEIGQSEDEVRAIFGEPELTETHKIKGIGRADCWYYGGLTLAVPTARICFKHGTVKAKARYGNK